jgi:hypothetical protein
MGEYGMMLMIVIDDEHSDQQQTGYYTEQQLDREVRNEYGSGKGNAQQKDG